MKTKNIRAVVNNRKKEKYIHLEDIINIIRDVIDDTKEIFEKEKIEIFPQKIMEIILTDLLNNFKNLRD